MSEEDDFALADETEASVTLEPSGVLGALRWKTDRVSAALWFAVVSMTAALLLLGYTVWQLLLRLLMMYMCGNYVYGHSAKRLNVVSATSEAPYQPRTLTLASRLWLEDVIRDCMAVLMWRNTLKSLRVFGFTILLAVALTLFDAWLVLYAAFVVVFLRINMRAGAA